MGFDFVIAQAQAFSLFAKLAEGLAFVHEETQMAHMDLKGDNVLLQMDQAPDGSSPSSPDEGGVLLWLSSDEAVPDSAEKRRSLMWDMDGCKKVKDMIPKAGSQMMHVIPKIIDFGSAVPVSSDGYWEDEIYTSRSFFSFSPHQIRAPELLDRGDRSKNRRGAGSDVWALAQLPSYYAADWSIAGPPPVFWYHPKKAKWKWNPVDDDEELPEREVDTWCLFFRPNAPFSMTSCAWDLFRDVFVHRDAKPGSWCVDPDTGESIEDAWPVRPIEDRMSAKDFGKGLQKCNTRNAAFDVFAESFSVDSMGDETPPSRSTETVAFDLPTEKELLPASIASTAPLDRGEDVKRRVSNSIAPTMPLGLGEDADLPETMPLMSPRSMPAPTPDLPKPNADSVRRFDGRSQSLVQERPTTTTNKKMRLSLPVMQTISPSDLLKLAGRWVDKDNRDQTGTPTRYLIRIDESEELVLEERAAGGGPLPDIPGSRSVRRDRRDRRKKRKGRSLHVEKLAGMGLWIIDRQHNQAEGQAEWVAGQLKWNDGRTWTRDFGLPPPFAEGRPPVLEVEELSPAEEFPPKKKIPTPAEEIQPNCDFPR